MATLAYLKVHDTLHPPSSSFGGLSTSKSSFISSFLPNLQGQGPTGSLLRILLKLHQITFVRLLNMFGQDSLFSFSREKVEELKGRAIKVVDLLQHSAELGNMDALYALAQVSLVCAIDFFLFGLIKFSFPVSTYSKRTI
jgi:SEL1 protein